jgi:hypothetical protein
VESGNKGRERGITVSMLLPVTKNDAVAFLNFINQLYDKASFIITTINCLKDGPRFSMMMHWLLLCLIGYYINVRLLNSKEIVTE